MEPFEATLLLIGTFLALFGFSFAFFGDNNLFAFSENIYIGGVTATALYATFKSIQTSSIDFVLRGNIVRIIPIIIGLLAFLRLTRYRWASRYTISILTGVGIGITFGLTIKTWVMNAVIEAVGAMISLKPDPYSAVFMLISTLTVITYFLYSVKYSSTFNTGRMKYIATLGRYMLYASFGYLFAKIFVNEALDSLANFLVTYVYQSIVDLKIFFGIV